MPGLADLLFLGQPDPARQLALALAGRQQPQIPPGAPPPGPGPAGPGPAPNAPAPNAQPVNADPNAPAPNPAPGAPPPPGSPPQPTALQSTPDMSASYSTLANPPNLMSLYLQLQQRQAASDQINRGLALITANHSPPSMREAIMQSMTGGGQDAGSTVNNLMSLYQGQQQMAAQQQLMAQAPDIAAKLGLPVAVVQARIAAGGGADLVKSMEQTTEQRNVQWEHDQFIKGGGDEATWQRDYLPMIISRGMPGASDPMWQVYRTERQHALETDPNTPFPNYADWTAQRQATANADLQKKQAQTQALKNLPTYDGALTSLQATVNDVFNPDNKKDLDAISKVAAMPVIGRQIMEAAQDPDKASVLAQLGASAGLTPPQIELIRKLHELSGTDLRQLTAADPNRAQDLLPIGSVLPGLSRFDLGTAALQKRGAALADAIGTARANAHGAAGNLANMPDELRLKMDPSYGWGGSNFSGTGAAMTTAEIADAQDDMKTEPKKDVIRYWRAKGKITTPIE